MTRDMPGTAFLISIFFGSLIFFSKVFPVILESGPVYVLGVKSAAAHQVVLSALGIPSTASFNLLVLKTGLAVEYTPYCFGLMTIAAFMILMAVIPGLGLKERLLWTLFATLALFILNQLRIIIELLVVYGKPHAFTTIDMLFYPLLPVAALGIFYTVLHHSGFRSYRGGVKSV